MITSYPLRVVKTIGALAFTLGMLLKLTDAVAAPTVTVMAWGTTWEQGMQSIADSFTKKTGIKVVPVTQAGSSDGYARLKSMSDAPTIDVWFSTASLASRATQDKKLFSDIPDSKLSNVSHLIGGAKAAGWVAAYYYPLSIVYRPSLVKRPITAWTDLWDPRFANSLAVPDVETYAGRMLLISALTHGGDIMHVDPGFAALQKLKPNIAMFYGSDSDARRALAQGDVSVLVGPPSQAKPLVDAGVDVKVISPKPAPVMFDVMTLVNTKNKEAALQFIDYVISAQSQSVITHAMNMGPVNDTVKADAVLQAELPAKADQVSFDENVINDHIGAWNDKFKAEIAK